MDLEIRGYVRDLNANAYSRDIGRSFELGGRIYYLFGDTFCKNKDGKFVGLVSNTIALVPNPTCPLRSQYLRVDHAELVMPFLALNNEEEQLQDTQPSQRVTLWPFGGVAAITSTKGVVWYQKGIEHKDSHHEFCGIGIAEVEIEVSGVVTSKRLPALAFGPSDPRIGSFSVLRHLDYVYLFGERSTDMLVARTKPHSATQPATYQYWTGHENAWLEDIDRAIAIFSEIPQGQIFHSPQIGGSDTPFVLIGVNKWADSRVRMGTAASPQGPWDIREVATARGLDYPNDYMYCIYPHPWASNDSELAISWSEHWPGGVVAATLNLHNINLA